MSAMSNISDLKKLQRGVSFGTLAAVCHFSSDDNLEHDAPTPINSYAFVFVLSGRATLSLDTVSYALDSHTTYMVSPMHQSYWHSLSPDFSAFALFVSPQLVRTMPVQNIEQHVEAALLMYNKPIFQINDEQRNTMVCAIDDCRRQMERTENPYQLELVKNAVARFYLEWDTIILDCLKNIRQERDDNRRTAIFFRFISLLTANYRSRHGVTFYAEQLNITPQYLSSIVKKETSHSVAELASIMLYRQSRNMLRHTDLSIKLVAEDLNFADQASFCKFFRRYAGMSPSDFRGIGK